MLKVEHIGIAVKKLSSAIPLFEKLLNTPCYKTETVITEQVNTAFFKQGETKIELLESVHAEGVIARYIEKRGEGMHHIAFEKYFGPRQPLICWKYHNQIPCAWWPGLIQKARSLLY